MQTSNECCVTKIENKSVLSPRERICCFYSSDRRCVPYCPKRSDLSRITINKSSYKSCVCGDNGADRKTTTEVPSLWEQLISKNHNNKKDGQKKNDRLEERDKDAGLLNSLKDWWEAGYNTVRPLGRDGCRQTFKDSRGGTTPRPQEQWRVQLRWEDRDRKDIRCLGEDEERGECRQEAMKRMNRASGWFDCATSGPHASTGSEENKDSVQNGLTYQCRSANRSTTWRIYTRTNRPVWCMCHRSDSLS